MIPAPADLKQQDAPYCLAGRRLRPLLRLVKFTLFNRSSYEHHFEFFLFPQGTKQLASNAGGF
jgi:hypothetical protein